MRQHKLPYLHLEWNFFSTDLKYSSVVVIMIKSFLMLSFIDQKTPAVVSFPGSTQVYRRLHICECSDANCNTMVEHLLCPI